MNDPEFVKLRNTFLLGVFVAVIFSVPLFMFFYKTYSRSNVLNMLNKKETFTILVVNNDCETCGLVDDIMAENNVDYVKLNRDTNKDYDTIIKKLDIVNKREQYPIIVIVEEGMMKANLFNITDEAYVMEFLTAYNLVNSRK